MATFEYFWVIAWKLQTKKNKSEMEKSCFVVLFGMLQEIKTIFVFVPVRTGNDFYYSKINEKSLVKTEIYQFSQKLRPKSKKKQMN